MKNDKSKAINTIKTKSMGRPQKNVDEKVIASLSGDPKWSVNSAGAAPVPPSAPSIVIKSIYTFLKTIVFTIDINSQG